MEKYNRMFFLHIGIGAFVGILAGLLGAPSWAAFLAGMFYFTFLRLPFWDAEVKRVRQ